MSDLRQELLSVFGIEYRDHIDAIRQILADAETAGEDAPDFNLKEVTRRAHSLKGAARAVGLEEVEALAHRLESTLIDLESKGRAPEGSQRRSIAEALDEIEDKVVAELSGQPATEPAVSEAPESEPEAMAGSGPTTTPEENESAPQAAGSKPVAQPPAQSQPRGTGIDAASVRVSAEMLDRLLKSAGELRADMLFQNLSAVEFRQLGEAISSLERSWSRTWQRMEAVLRKSDASSHPGLTKHARVVSTEIQALAKRWRAATQTHDHGARSLRHHLDDLERRVKSARMMPTESVFGSFRKMVRDLAKSEGKKVEVSVTGLDCEADRLVVQRIKDPVMHMLRNAVDHGIETPEQRDACGKPPEGHIALSVFDKHDRLHIVIEDDGRGLDYRKIADKAVQAGRLSPEDAEAASQQALVELLFETGFSTADSVTTISGRGVGLSVVRETITGLQGTFDIDSTPGAGTRIAISLPISVLSRRLLLVSFQEQTYAMPTEAIAKAMRIAAEDIVTIEGRPAVRLEDSTLPLVSIGQILGFGDPAVAPAGETISIVVVRATTAQASQVSHLGVAVDSLVGVTDLVVRNLEVGAPESRMWTGIVSLADGSPCLVLNTGSFFRNELGMSHAVFREGESLTDEEKVVLVVDDSITTRSLEKSILEAHGFKVLLSVDGRDALNVLRENRPNVVVSDIEMPNVNGFELVREMKSDKALADIPVVLVTSRSDDEDRTRGLELGADAYIIKQRFDQNELLRAIRQIV